MKFPKLVRYVRIKIIYKSGASHEFYCRAFKLTPGHSATWDGTPMKNTPLHLGLDDISAVYQTGFKTRAVWE